MAINASRSGLWPTTHWSQVGEAGQGGVEERCRALTSLVKVYLPVLRRHLLYRRHVDCSQVDDVLQDFLTSKILENDILRLAVEGKGRFRNFLATALNRFVVSRFRMQNAAKRRAIHHGSLEAVDPGELASGITYSDAFDWVWARQVLGRAIRHMRVQCSKPSRRQIWGVFRGRLLLPTFHNVPPVPFKDLADDLRLDSPKVAANLLTTANQIFANSLRSVISAYDNGTADVESELCDLRQILSRPNRERPRF